MARKKPRLTREFVLEKLKFGYQLMTFARDSQSNGWLAHPIRGVKVPPGTLDRKIVDELYQDGVICFLPALKVGTRKYNPDRHKYEIFKLTEGTLQAKMQTK